jgi:predicted flavoprotein YhiN
MISMATFHPADASSAAKPFQTLAGMRQHGVALDEVAFATMESRLRPGLFFAGEILDVDGLTGGFNLQAAWTTGWLAGRGLARRVEEGLNG